MRGQGVFISLVIAIGLLLHMLDYTTWWRNHLTGCSCCRRRESPDPIKQERSGSIASIRRTVGSEVAVA